MNSDVTARQCTEADVQRQFKHLQLLLTLTNRITSNLELPELLRAISANVREVMQCDSVGIALADSATGKHRIYAVDFPSGKGCIREGLIVSPSPNDPAKRAFDTLKPVLASAADYEDFPPEIREVIREEGYQSNCFIPLANHGRALGILAISRTTEGSFTPDDVDFLTRLRVKLRSRSRTLSPIRRSRS